jgi:hypothetical protein
MRRDVGLLGLTFTSLGCVIGSGWLLSALESSSVAGPAAILARKKSFAHEELDLRTFSWLVPYFIGLAAVAYLGQFSGGRKILPFGVDLAVVAVFALVIYFLAVRQSAPSQLVARYLEEDTEPTEAQAAPAG